MFTCILYNMTQNANGKLFVRGRIVDTAAGLEQAKGIRFRAYLADCPEMVSAANTVIEAKFTFGKKDVNTATGAVRATIHNAKILRTLTPEEAAPYEAEEAKYSLQDFLTSNAEEWAPTNDRTPGMSAQADAQAVSEAAAADVL